MTTKQQTPRIAAIAGAASDFKATLAQHLTIDDWAAVDIVIATTVAHRLHGEMIWLRIIGASGSGKTEILRAIMAQEGFSEEIERLSPASLRGGMKGGPKLLERLDGKLVVTKELAPIMTSHKDFKLELFGLLRSVGDGRLVSDFGSWEGRLVQTAHFDWLLASTVVVDRQAQMEQLLGSRFIDLRWGGPQDRLGAVRQAIANNPHMTLIRASLQKAMSRLIAEVTKAPLPMPSPPDDWLIKLADMAARLRTSVQRDGYRREIIALPQAEIGTRLGQSFCRIRDGLSLIGIEDAQPHLLRLAWDCVPPAREATLKALMGGASSSREIARGISLSHVFARRQVEDLCLLGFCDSLGHLTEDVSILGAVTE